MAITQTGSTLQFGFPATSTNTGTVSSTITVPGDAEAVVAAVSAYPGGTAGYRGSGSMTFTKGGSQVAMTSVGAGGDTTNQWGAAMFYLALPDTGSNKTLNWDWLSTGTAPDPVQNFSVTFWKGVDTSSLARDGDGAQASNFPVTTPTLTCVSGDLIVAFCGYFRVEANGTGSVDSWSNLTELTEITHEGYAEGTWATGSPSGDTTVAASTGQGTEPGIVAVVLKVAAGGTTLDATTAGSYTLSGSTATDRFTLTALQAGA